MPACPVVVVAASFRDVVGSLKGFRHGRVLRFHEPDVDELAKTGMIGSTSERHREAARQRREGM